MHRGGTAWLARGKRRGLGGEISCLGILLGTQINVCEIAQGEKSVGGQGNVLIVDYGCCSFMVGVTSVGLAEYLAGNLRLLF